MHSMQSCKELLPSVAKAAEETAECLYRRRCYQCRDLVVGIRSLLDEWLSANKKNENAAHLICNFCNRFNTSGRCKRCEFLANRYKISETINEDARQQRFKIWLCKVKQFLNTILERETCKHQDYPRFKATDELTNLLHELKSPLTIREPEIDYFPSIDLLQNIKESKDILEQVLMRLNNRKSSSQENKISDDKKTSKKERRSSKEEQSSHKGENKISNSSRRNKKAKGDKQGAKNGPSKQSKGDSEPEHILQMIKKTETKKDVDKPIKAPPPSTVSKIEELPIPVCSYAESFAVCDRDDADATEMVKGNRIVQIEDRAGLDTGSVEPLFFKVQPACLSLPDHSSAPCNTTPTVTTDKAKKSKDAVVKEPKKLKHNSKDEKQLSIDAKKSFNQENKISDDKKTSKQERRSSKEEKSSPKEGNKAPNSSKGDKKAKDDKQGAKKGPFKKSKGGSEQEHMLQTMKKTGMKKDVEKPVKAPPSPTIPKIEELPIPVRSFAESFAECDRDDAGATEMVKGNRIVPIEDRTGLDTGSVEPLFFKVQPECLSLPDHSSTSSNTTPTVTTDKAKESKEKVEAKEAMSGKGVLRYMLSNREFIDKGWTILPKTKIMRRINIYKMEPANPKSDWFDRHKAQRIIYHDTGEKFAEIDEKGSGKWYYKNGALALDYYCDKDLNGRHRYVLYSSGDNTDAGRPLPVTVLASFDYLGNGVVYDHYGNERLKYNQSEGIVIDEKIGPPGRWKWHTLNEPPVLQPVFVETHERPTGCLEDLLRGRNNEVTGSKHKKESNLEMLAIELENFKREKAAKLLQEFKPLQIKMKVLKVNDQFLLRVLDQTSIYLLFRDGQTSIKVNLGMLLISNEIIDTDTAEATLVATPYDRHPPKSESIADIQIALEEARKLGRARGKRHY